VNVPILLAQCKAYQPFEDISKVVDNILKIHSPASVHLHLALPYSFIEPISKQIEAGEKGIKVGAEVLLDTDENSFTASCAGKILKKAGAQFVLIGTTEDRTTHNPNTNHLRNKVKTALDAHIPAFVCIGESKQEHQDNKSKEVLTKQLKEALEDFSLEELQAIYVVYNPDWITQTPWEAGSPELQEAYRLFHEIIQETLPPEAISNERRILAVPAYSQELSKLVTQLSGESHAYTGYSIGTLGLSSEFLKPLFDPPPSHA
jgi:triosephosphate isomerase (TIM)